jgi:hypothetical protein
MNADSGAIIAFPDVTFGLNQLSKPGITRSEFHGANLTAS